MFVRNGSTWSQQAYLKASNTQGSDNFGISVAVSGETVVAGAQREASSATGVDGNQADNSAGNAGAAYVFGRSGTTWSQQAYLKASNTGSGDQFGSTVAVSGNTVVVGAADEDSSATGVNGNGADNSASGAGAAYIFVIPPSAAKLLVADTLNNRIQRYEAGNWTVLTSPAFVGPEAVTADPAGSTIYVADTGQNMVWCSTDGGTSWNAFVTALNGPQGLVLDSLGNLYVSNTGAGTVLRYNSAGTLTATIFTSGSGTNQTQNPRGLALDSSFTLYVADYGATVGASGRILRVTNANGTPGTYSQVAGYGSSAAPLMQVRNPESVALDANRNLYVADAGNNRILRRAGGTSGPGMVLCPLSPSLTSPALGQVRGVEGVSIVDAALVGGTAGQPAIVVADTQNNRIQGSLSTTGGGFFLVGTPNGTGTGTGQFRSPGKIR